MKKLTKLLQSRVQNVWRGVMLLISEQSYRRGFMHGFNSATGLAKGQRRIPTTSEVYQWRKRFYQHNRSEAPPGHFALALGEVSLRPAEINNCPGAEELLNTLIRRQPRKTQVIQREKPLEIIISGQIAPK